MLEGRAISQFCGHLFTLAFFINSLSKYLLHAFVLSAFPSFVQFILQIIGLHNLIFIKHHHSPGTLLTT